VDADAAIIRKKGDLGCFERMGDGHRRCDAMRLHRSLSALHAVATSALVVHWSRGSGPNSTRPVGHDQGVPSIDNSSHCHAPASSALRRVLPVSVVPTVLSSDRRSKNQPRCARASEHHTVFFISTKFILATFLTVSFFQNSYTVLPNSYTILPPFSFAVVINFFIYV
jgi:hypothetical protein